MKKCANKNMVQILTHHFSIAKGGPY